LYLRDTDGDGKADERRVEWSGFVPGSQQLRANALHWGLDNWIYGANGRCDGEVRRAGDSGKPAVSIRARDFRFRLPSGEFESISGQSQFGQCHDDWGNRFLSWNVIPIRQTVVPEPYASERALLQPRSLLDIAPADDTGRVFPVSPPPQQFNAERAEYYNAMCGLTIFRGDALGDDYRGNAFVGESLSNLVTRRILKSNGVAFSSERGEHGREFLAGGDPWFHPVFLATGPDGALYLADFYREYVEHPIYVSSQEIRKRIPWTTGAENGRLWRIRRQDARELTHSRRPQLAKATNEQLVAALSHPVGWWRDTAQRLLVERQDRAAISLVTAAFQASKSPVGAVKLLWTLEGLGGASDPVLRSALESTEPRVREQAIAIASQKAARIGTLLPQLAELFDDPDVGVRYRLALALGSLPPDEVRLHALVQLARSKPSDAWILAAVQSSATGQSAGLLRMLGEVDAPMLSSADAIVVQFLLDAGEQTAAELEGEGLSAFAEWCVDAGGQTGSPSVGRLALLCGVARGNDRLRGAASTAAMLKFLSSKQRAQLAEAASSTARDRAGALAMRKSSLRIMALASPADSATRLRQLLADRDTTEIRAAIAETLAETNDLEVCKAVYGDWDRMARDVRYAVLAASTRSENATVALLEALTADVVRPVEVPIDVVERLKHSGSEAIRKRVAAAFRANVSTNRREVVARYQAAVATNGDPVQGAAVFRENCIACHTIQRFGQQVGPELSGSSSRARELLLNDILDPSAQISNDFVNYVLVKQDGKTFEGLIVSQGGDAVRLRRAQGEEIVVPVQSIEQLRASNKSLMPEGFETKITPQAMGDLLAFLRQPSRDLLKANAPAPAAGGSPAVGR
jgi:putative membrane-bound dehydrogenase-like protein